MRFKEYLNEYINDKKEWEFMLDYYVPLKPYYFDNKKQKVYRIAGEKSLNNMIKNQNTKTMYSGFTKSSNDLSTGIYSGGDYLYELYANVVFKAEYDFFTNIDRNGYKWFSSGVFKYKIIPLVDKYFENKIEFYKNKISKSTDYNVIYTYLNATDITGKDHKKTKGKRKQDFIKWYYDTSKKLLTKDLLKEIKQEIISNKSITYSNDEVVFNDYKITGIFIPVTKEMSNSEVQQRKEKIKDFKGYIMVSDIAKINLPKISADKFVIKETNEI